jgi:hypothetical protein
VKIEGVPIVGSVFHTAGPLVLGTAAVRKLVQTRDSKTIASLRKDKKAVGVRTIAKQPTLIFAGNFSSTYRSLGDRAGVVVRLAPPKKNPHFKKGEDLYWHSVPRALTLDPWLVPEDSYELEVERLELDESPRFVFDAWSRQTRTPTERDMGKLTVDLPAGSYVIDRAAYGEKKFRVILFRIRPEGEIPAPAKGRSSAKAPGPPPDLVLRKETIALAKKVRFVSGEEDGPLFAIPKALLPSWSGLEGKDFDRACDTKRSVIRVGDGDAIVIPYPNNIAFVSLPKKTSLILLGIGVEDDADVLEAALSARESAWKKLKETFTMKGKKIALFDAADAGTEKPLFVGTLAPGRYSIERMDEFNGKIVVGKNKRRRVMAGALRLRPI